MLVSTPPDTVLGIDAAWTAGNPSGVALAARERDGWRIIAAASSIAGFVRLPGGERDASVAGVIDAAAEIGSRRPALVAVDMPMMDEPIDRRRAADNAVTRAYAGRGAGTHSPTPERPGAVGRAMETALAAAGYPLATTEIRPPCRIEIYPHPALIELTGASYRLPYKAGNTGKYWPGLPLTERRAKLFSVWRTIVDALDQVMTGSPPHCRCRRRRRAASR